MEPITDQPSLIVILGQTASGKTDLALKLAKQFGGEIIAADSRTVYKGMDIGTAKPTLLEREIVRHHLIDVVTPDQTFTVADFQRLANDAISNIASRGKLSFLVGGSGLYIDSVIYNFSFRRPGTTDTRQKLEELSVDELQAMLEEQNLPVPDNENNPRHLIRALETKGEVPKRSGLRPNTLIIGLMKDRDVLESDIRRRVDTMLKAGFVDEVQHLSKHYGLDALALQAPGYKDFRLYLAGQISIDDARRQFVRSHLQYSKRQKTWFKRNKDINWISKQEEAVDLITTFLNN